MRKNLRAMSAMVRHLDDEYEVNQLNPIWTKDTDTVVKSKDLADSVNKLPEETSMRLRIATMEAIIDQVVEDEVEENPEITPKELQDVTEPIVDKAINLSMVPSVTKKLINQVIARHLKKRNPRMQLMTKCARYMTQAMTRMEESDVTVNSGQDEAAKEIVSDAVNPESNNPNAGTTETTIEPEKEQVTNEQIDVESPLPAPAEASMRFLAASTINERKAQIAVMKNIAGPMSAYMFHELRYCLPESFKQKYNIR